MLATSPDTLLLQGIIMSITFILLIIGIGGLFFCHNQSVAPIFCSLLASFLLFMIAIFLPKLMQPVGFYYERFEILSLDEYDNNFLFQVDYPEGTFIARKDEETEELLLPIKHKFFFETVSFRIKDSGLLSTSDQLDVVQKDEEKEAYVLRIYKQSRVLINGKYVPIISRILESKELYKTEYHIPTNIFVIELP